MISSIRIRSRTVAMSASRIRPATPRESSCLTCGPAYAGDLAVEMESRPVAEVERVARPEDRRAGLVAVRHVVHDGHGAAPDHGTDNHGGHQLCRPVADEPPEPGTETAARPQRHSRRHEHVVPGRG